MVEARGERRPIQPSLPHFGLNEPYLGWPMGVPRGTVGAGGVVAGAAVWAAEAFALMISPRSRPGMAAPPARPIPSSAGSRNVAPPLIPSRRSAKHALCLTSVAPGRSSRARGSSDGGAGSATGNAARCGRADHHDCMFANMYACQASGLESTPEGGFNPVLDRRLLGDCGHLDGQAEALRDPD
jgi:hypothetical protein